MKKSLLALAALSAFATAAQAQSNVSIYGILDMGYSDLSTMAKSNAGAADGATTDTKAINSAAGLSSSRLGFRGTEDLGGGLSAGFTYELGLTPENATTAHTTRQALISLSSKTMGSLNFGRGNTLGKNHNDTFSAFGGGASFEQGAVAYEVTRGKALADANAVLLNSSVDRASNQATYISPAFNGFTVAAQLVSKSVDSDASAKGGETSSSGTAFSLAYAAGPIAATYTRTNLETQVEAAAAINPVSSNGSTSVLGVAAVTAATSKSTVDQFGATYTIGALKVFGLYNDAEYQATAGAEKAENKGYDIGATYTMGNTTLLASFGDGEMKAAGATTVTDVSGMQAQVRYALSKRTTAYALYGKTEYKGATKGESDVSMIGVRHSF
jgi:predicted porin